MLFQRLLSLIPVLAALPLLAACNQTAAPATPGVVGSGALAAIADAQSTQAKHQATSFVLNHAASQDPTGLSGYAINYIEDEQARVEEEKYRRVDEEVEKTLAEAEAWQALSENLERQKAGNGRKPAPRRATP